jgi:quinol monooxygenase YgiN
MSNPIVFISRHRIKEGKTDEFRRHYQNSVAPIYADKPGTLAQLAYENEEATEFMIVRLFPNAEALDLQMQGADERSKKTYEYLEPIGVEIYGAPSPATLERMKKIAGSRVAVTIRPRYVGGFIR